MPVEYHTLRWVYLATDFDPPHNDLEWGATDYTIVGTPKVMEIMDDDPVLQDNNNNYGQTRDTDDYSQALSAPFDGLPAGTPVYSRASFSVTVTLPNGEVRTGEAQQIRFYATGTRYFAFDFKVTPGSHVEFTAEDNIGDTPYSQFVCFSAGTLIATPEGERPVESLRPGDLVTTADHGAQAIRWTGARSFTAADLRANPTLVPVRIKAGAMGRRLPRRDLVVSPQHRMLLRSKIVQRMFSCDEVLIAAKKLTHWPGIGYDHNLPEITYVHFLCSRHEVVIAEGALSESLYPGAEALKGLDEDAVAELLTIFPDLAEAARPPEPARQIIRGPRQRQLLKRHRVNCVALTDAFA